MVGEAHEGIEEVVIEGVVVEVVGEEEGEEAIERLLNTREEEKNWRYQAHGVLCWRLRHTERALHNT